MKIMIKYLLQAPSLFEITLNDNGSYKIVKAYQVKDASLYA